MEKPDGARDEFLCERIVLVVARENILPEKPFDREINDEMSEEVNPSATEGTYVVSNRTKGS